MRASASPPSSSTCAGTSLVDQVADHGLGDRAGERVAAVGAAVVAGLEPGGDGLGHGEGAQREPAGDALGHGEEVGLGAGGGRREQRPRAAEARLHLVDDEQRAVGAAEPRELAQVVRRGDAHAALALDGLDDHRRDLVVERRLHRVRAAVRHEPVARHQRAELVAVLRLPGGRDHADGAAVEAARRWRSPRCGRWPCAPA